MKHGKNGKKGLDTELMSTACANCNNETKNPKFCSRSCANVYNNSVYKKRVLKKKCKTCPRKIKSSRTYCDKCWEEHRRNTKYSPCKIHGIQKFSHDGKTFRCSKCHNEKTARHRRKVKSRLVDIFGGKCQCCGYSTTVWALTFHHVDESTKEFSIGSGDTRAWTKVLEEAKKCILVCFNCHQEIHAGIRDISGIAIGHSYVA